MTFKRALHLVTHVAIVTSLYGIGVATSTADDANDGSCASANDDNNINEDGTCSSSSVTATSISTDHLNECSIWLAPSSLPGAGLGMYAGRAFQKGELLHPTGDVVIPITDINMHQRGRGKFPFLWDEYTWNGKSLGMALVISTRCGLLVGASRFFLTVRPYFYFLLPQEWVTK